MKNYQLLRASLTERSQMEELSNLLETSASFDDNVFVKSLYETLSEPINLCYIFGFLVWQWAGVLYR